MHAGLAAAGRSNRRRAAPPSSVKIPLRTGIYDPAPTLRWRCFLPQDDARGKSGPASSIFSRSATGPSTGRTDYEDMIAKGQIGALLNIATCERDQRAPAHRRREVAIACFLSFSGWMSSTASGPNSRFHWAWLQPGIQPLVEQVAVLPLVRPRRAEFAGPLLPCGYCARRPLGRIAGRRGRPLPGVGNGGSLRARLLGLTS